MKDAELRPRRAKSELPVKEHKAAEKNVRQEDEFIDVIIDSLPYPFYIINTDNHRILKANAAAGGKQASKTITCYELTHKRSKPCSDKNHPCPLKTVKKTKKPVTVEHVHYDTKGNTKVYEVTAYPVFDNRRNVTQVIECALDITERRQAEEQLKTNLLMLDQSPNSAALLDKDGVVQYANSKLLEAYGLSPEKVVGMNWRSFLSEHSTLREKLQEMQSTVTKKGEIWKGEVSDRNEDGELIWRAVTILPIKNAKGEVINIAYTSEDITERKRTEDELKTSEERLKILFELAPEAYYLHDLQGTFLDGNKRAEKIIGYSRDELIGKNFFTLNLLPNTEILKAKESLSKSTRGKPTGPDEFILRRKNGSEIPVEISTFPVKIGGKSIVLGIARDITERKQAERLTLIQRDLALTLCTKAELALDEGLRFCLEAAINVSEMDCGGIYLVDEKYGLNLIRHKGLSPEFIKSATHYDTDSPSTRLILAGKPVYSKHQKLGVSLDEPRLREGLRAIAIIPIIHEDRVIACLNIASHTLEEVPSSSRSALETTAAQIGSAIKRLKAEEALRESEEHYRQLIEISPEAIIVQHKNKIVLANTAAARLVSAETPEQLIGKPIVYFVHPQYRKAVDNRIRRVIEKQTAVPFIEQDFVRLDGRVINMEVAVTPFTYQSELAVQIIARDITERKQAEEDREESFQRLRRSLEETVGALSSTIEMRDAITSGHQKRVAALAVAIAEEMGLSGEQIDGIRMAGLVHDIGKIYIPSDLLNKSSRLTGPEFEMFKSHCQVGYDILKTIDFPWPVAPIVLQHHERQDGSGYPQGLYGRDIILEARIIAVADVIEAMSGHRPYRPAYSLGDALEEVLHNKDSLYDPDVVDACLRVFYDKGFVFEEVEKNEFEIKSIK